MPKGVSTVLYEDFSAGINETTGPLARDARMFSQLTNFLVTDAKKLQRRTPCDKIAGLRDANTQGLLFLNGQYVTVAKAGTTVAHTIVSPPITTLYFDNPEFCTDWELIDILSFNETVVAVIKHTYPVASVPSRVMFHVWDGKRPTWVDDPAAPTNWSKSFPLHAYGTGTLGAFKDYIPAVATSSDKIIATTPDGNLGFCATNRPRVWTTRNASDILTDGRWWYWISPTTGVFEVTIPVPYTDFTTAATYAAYVAEECGDNGAWTQLQEVTGSALAAYQYSITNTPNRFVPTDPDETKLVIRASAAGRVVRFRALAKPPLAVNLGAYLVPTGVLTAGTLTLEGATEDYPATALVVPPLAPATSYLLAAWSSRRPGYMAAPPAIAGVSTTMPFNGQQRYWSRFVAVATTNGTGTAFSFDLTGTVSVAPNSSLVVGVGTLFLTELRVGDEVEANGEKRTIKFIRNNTFVEVTQPFTATAAGVPMTRDVRYRYAYQIGETGNAWYAAREAEATFTLAGEGDAGTLNSSLYDNTGDVPLALVPGQNRLFVLYRSATQLWQTDQDPVNVRLLSVVAFGAGPNTAPRGTIVDGIAVLPTHAGPRMFSPDGLNKDYIKMGPIGDVLQPNDLPNFTAAGWWGRMRILLFASSSDPRLYAFSYHPDSKVGAWSIWTVEGLDGVDRIFTADEYLYIQRGQELWRFNPAATVFKDSTDTTPFTSRARWLHNDLGSPNRNKHIVRFELAQAGAAAVSLFVSPFEPTDEAPGPAVSGMTQGRMSVPLATLAPTIALQIETTDQTGYELYAVGFDYRLIGR